MFCSAPARACVAAGHAGTVVRAGRGCCKHSWFQIGSRGLWWACSATSSRADRAPRSSNSPQTQPLHLPELSYVGMSGQLGSSRPGAGREGGRAALQQAARAPPCAKQQAAAHAPPPAPLHLPGMHSFHASELAELPPRLRSLVEDNRMMKEHLRRYKQRAQEAEHAAAKQEQQLQALGEQAKRLRQQLAEGAASPDALKAAEQHRQHAEASSRALEVRALASRLLQRRSVHACRQWPQWADRCCCPVRLL